MFLEIPNVSHYWLINARIPLCLLDQDWLKTRTGLHPIAALAAWPHQEALVAVDVEICDRKIRTILPTGTPETPPEPSINLQQGLIWPCFVDIHTHLDKGQLWPRLPNPDGRFDSALETIRQDCAKGWNEDSLYRRMQFGLQCSYAHGTQAVRTHLDAFGVQGAISFKILQTLAQAWADRLTLQAVCLVSLDYFLTPEGEALADLVAEHRGVLGGVAFMNPDLATQLDRTFKLAKERQLDLDFHADESLNPADISLRYIAEAALRNEFTGQITCGHCCSLSVQSPTELNKTLELVKAANIAIVSLPMCNLYLQDRQADYTPRYRGVTDLHALKAREIPVAIASDNCRDPFYAYGDHDGLEVFTQAARIGHLDRPYGSWPTAITSTPAMMMGLGVSASLGVGGNADMILFKARTLNELMARAQFDRVVIRGGKAIDTTLPDYAELDGLR
jgi:cytosine/creatinine deaminase